LGYKVYNVGVCILLFRAYALRKGELIQIWILRKGFMGLCLMSRGSRSTVGCVGFTIESRRHLEGVSKVS
jgi:hypothetical protein